MSTIPPTNLVTIQCLNNFASHGGYGDSVPNLVPSDLPENTQLLGTDATGQLAPAVLPINSSLIGTDTHGVIVDRENFTLNFVTPTTIPTPNILTQSTGQTLTPSQNYNDPNAQTSSNILAIRLNSTNYPGTSPAAYAQTNFNITNIVAANDSVGSTAGQNGTNRNAVMFGVSNTGGAAPLDMIFNTNYIRFSQYPETPIGAGTNIEHVCINTNAARNNKYALGVKGNWLWGTSTVAQGGPCYQMQTTAPAAIRTITLADPGADATLVTGVNTTNTATIRSGQTTNPRTIPFSSVYMKLGAPLVLSSSTLSGNLNLNTTPLYDTSIVPYSITSTNVKLPSDSTGKVYKITLNFDYTCSTTSTDLLTFQVKIRANGAELRSAGYTVSPNTTMGFSNSSNLVAIYTSVANSETVDILASVLSGAMSAGQTLTIGPPGSTPNYFLIEELARKS